MTTGNYEGVKHVVRLTTVVAFSILVLLACGPAKPDGSKYLGKWEGTIEGSFGEVGSCHLDISKLGESFVIKSERQTFGNCAGYEGVVTLTPEGNLTNGGMVLSFDKAKNQVVVSGFNKLRYLTKSK
jgi:hypothetical protein